MNNKKKIILTSAITIATCLALITGSTFALFTDDDTKLNVAITAGDFDITATPVDNNNDGTTDFTVASELAGKLPVGSASFDANTNVIKIINMVPGDYVTFLIKVQNNGNIAADCTVNFEQTKLTAAESPADMEAGNINKLYDALTASLYVVEGTTETPVFENKSLNDDTMYDATSSFTLDAGEYATFKVTIKFPDATNNNDYIYTNCGITYSVFAVQHNEPANP